MKFTVLLSRLIKMVWFFLLRAICCGRFNKSEIYSNETGQVWIWHCTDGYSASVLIGGLDYCGRPQWGRGNEQLCRMKTTKRRCTLLLFMLLSFWKYIAYVLPWCTLALKPCYLNKLFSWLLLGNDNRSVSFIRIRGSEANVLPLHILISSEHQWQFHIIHHFVMYLGPYWGWLKKVPAYSIQIDLIRFYLSTRKRESLLLFMHVLYYTTIINSITYILYIWETPPWWSELMGHF